VKRRRTGDEISFRTKELEKFTIPIPYNDVGLPQATALRRINHYLSLSLIEEVFEKRINPVGPPSSFYLLTSKGLAVLNYFKEGSV
jgi:hypothetical protein